MWSITVDWCLHFPEPAPYTWSKFSEKAFWQPFASVHVSIIVNFSLCEHPGGPKGNLLQLWGTANNVYKHLLSYFMLPAFHCAWTFPCREETVMLPSSSCHFVLSHLQHSTTTCTTCFFNTLLPTSCCPAMLQRKLYSYRCMHKAHLWLNTLCMDGLYENCFALLWWRSLSLGVSCF